MFPYLAGFYADLVELLLVVAARLGTVVCHEDELLACARVSSRIPGFVRSESYLCSEASLWSLVSVEIGDRQTKARLSFSYRQSPTSFFSFNVLMLLYVCGLAEDSEKHGRRTIAVEEESLQDRSQRMSFNISSSRLTSN